jgi:hypothetical protein
MNNDSNLSSFNLVNKGQGMKPNIMSFSNGSYITESICNLAIIIVF